MKYIAAVICGLVGVACADPSVGTPFPEGEPSNDKVTEEATGTVVQKAQFADDTVLNLVGMVGQSPSPQLLLTADIDPVDVLVYYIGDKTFTNGTRTPSAPQLQRRTLARIEEV